MNPILLAQIEDEPGGGQRRPRASTFLQAELRCGKAPPETMRVRNISAGGMMVEWTSPPPAGTIVEARLRGIGAVLGRIVWRREDRAGVAFDVTIDPALTRKPERRSVDPESLAKPTSLQARRAPLRTR